MEGWTLHVLLVGLGIGNEIVSLEATPQHKIIRSNGGYRLSSPQVVRGLIQYGNSKKPVD